MICHDTLNKNEQSAVVAHYERHDLVHQDAGEGARRPDQLSDGERLHHPVGKDDSGRKEAPARPDAEGPRHGGARPENPEIEGAKQGPHRPHEEDERARRKPLVSCRPPDGAQPDEQRQLGVRHAPQEATHPGPHQAD